MAEEQRVAADAVRLIERDHRAMAALFDQVLAGEGDRLALVAEITARLTAHAEAKERTRHRTPPTAANRCWRRVPLARNCTRWPRRPTSPSDRA
jgi:hypothetical protein